MARVQKKNWVIPQGSTWRCSIIYDSDLDGWEARSQMRLTVEDEAIIFETDTTDADGVFTITLDFPEIGKAQLLFVIPSTVTAAFDFDTAAYDIEIYKDPTEVKRILQGVITLNKEVTR